MIRNMKKLLLPLMFLGLLLVVACGGSDEESVSFGPGGYPVAQAPISPEMSSKDSGIAEAYEDEEAATFPGAISKEQSIGDRGVFGPPGAPAALVPQPAAVPVEGDEGAFGTDVVLVNQERIIVRTVDMGIVVDDVPSAMDDIVALAGELGGWVVSSDRSRKHNGFVSFRVPADELDAAILRLRNSAVEVESEVTTSRDVTDEYVDLTARLTNLEATEVALLKLFDRAEDVEDALGVQRELTRIQEEKERHQGRIKFLEQTSAFSLVNVFLRLSPIDMSVDAGADQTLSMRQVARFRATFEPPEDMEDFAFTWDFGDGSPPITGNRTAPTLDENKRVTATVTHTYGDDRDSPFIVEVKMTASGEGGVAEGEDTLIATVTKLPTIEVFAGESRIVDEEEEVEFEGTFTHPQGLHDLTYSWDFGDGTPPVTGSLGDTDTSASATHEYISHRPFAYNVTLTITAQSDAGEVEATGSLQVLVNETDSWTYSGWSAGETGKTGVRALSGVGQGLGTVLIWIGIFSPVWIGIIAAVVLVRRFGLRLRFWRKAG